MNRAEAARRGRIGGLVAVARHGGAALTLKARRAWWERFEREVDPDLQLAPEDRHQRAYAAMRAYLARIRTYRAAKP